MACHQTGGENCHQNGRKIWRYTVPPPPPPYSRSGYNPDNMSPGQVFIQLMFLCKILEIKMRGGGGGGRREEGNTIACNIYRGTLTKFYLLRSVYQGLKYLLKGCYPKY